MRANISSRSLITFILLFGFRTKVFLIEKKNKIWIGHFLTITGPLPLLIIKFTLNPYGSVSKWSCFIKDILFFERGAFCIKDFIHCRKIVCFLSTGFSLCILIIKSKFISLKLKPIKELTLYPCSFECCHLPSKGSIIFQYLERRSSEISIFRSKHC